MSFRRLSDHPEERPSVTTSGASGSSMNSFPCSQEMSALLRGIVSPGPAKSHVSTVQWVIVTRAQG